MFVSVSDGLPKTSYIKMVDIWLITSLSIPFFEVRTTKFHTLQVIPDPMTYTRLSYTQPSTLTELMKTGLSIIMVKFAK